ncbi:MAG: adenylate/guanylate cyclase domain-containing protein [Rhizobiaceae bacterium]|nr:adenylate/guanylate cyclase domain-containing protein [Rhizobiaceae bacterium]
MNSMQMVGLFFGLLLVAALTVLRISDPQPLRAAREATFDQFQRWSPRPFEPMPIKVVDIDEASLKMFGQWPWPRDRIALLTERLAEAGAAAIAFDVLFSEPDRLSPRAIAGSVPGVDSSLLAKMPDNDEVFAKAVVGKPVVLGFGISNSGHYRPPVKAGFAYLGEDMWSAPPYLESATPLLPELAENASGIGHISLNPGRSSAIVRTVPLLLSDGMQFYPSLAIEALRVAQGASTYIVSGADVPGIVTEIKVGDFVVPTTASGELWLYFGKDDARRYISVKDVISSDAPTADAKAAINGSILFVGTSAAALQDIRTTALGENVPGVSIHAQILEQVLSGKYLSRPDWASGVEIFAIAAIGSLVVLLTVLVNPIIALGAGLFLTVIALLGSAFAASVGGVLIDPVAPIVAGTATHFAATGYRILVVDRERRAIRRAFGQYLSPSLLYRIENDRDGLKLGGDDRELTVMFVDVRNFTSISEQLSPSEVVRFLNTLFGALSPHVTDNDGTLDKFIGDSIMAFWNAPLDVRDHPMKATIAALAMRETIASLNRRDAFGFGADRPVSVGIGIHTGLACVGNLGAESRFNYSAVGDAVNIASRIESLCRHIGFDIILSRETASRLDRYALIDAGSLPLRGRRDKTHLYALLGGRELASKDAFRNLQSVHLEIVNSLSDNNPVHDQLISNAMTQAASLSIGLAEFYKRLSMRADDFRNERK